MHNAVSPVEPLPDGAVAVRSAAPLNVRPQSPHPCKILVLSPRRRALTYCSLKAALTGLREGSRGNRVIGEVYQREYSRLTEDLADWPL
jgi:hypothetical protein